MKQVTLLYRCSYCSLVFPIATKVPYDAVKQLIHSYVYDTEAPMSSLRYNINDCEEHLCGMDDTSRTTGIGKLIGYTVTEVPDEKDKRPCQLVK